MKPLISPEQVFLIVEPVDRVQPRYHGHFRDESSWDEETVANLWGDPVTKG